MSLLHRYSFLPKSWFFIFFFFFLFQKDNKQSHLHFPVTFYICYFCLLEGLNCASSLTHDLDKVPTAFKKLGFGLKLLHIKSQSDDYLTWSLLSSFGWARFCESCFNIQAVQAWKPIETTDFTGASFKSLCPDRFVRWPRDVQRYIQVQDAAR